VDSAERADLVAALGQLWHAWSDLRFGQMLRIAVGEPVIRDPGALPDAALRDGVARALREDAGEAPLAGPYWDTEARHGRTFANGLPRDPARIAHVLDALSQAWEAHSSLTFGRLIEFALDRGGVSENEYRSRLMLIEDGPLRTLLEEVAS
jgi:hypothetical protein